MATVTGVTADAIQAIDDSLIESADVNSLGHLQLIRKDSGVIDAGNIGVPAGSVVMFASSVIPSGWILCNGQALSRTAYPDLFTAIGVQFGAGDGSTTFNVPNMNQKFPRMDTSWLGWPGGSAGSHTHGIATHTHAGATHDHDLENGSTAAHARFAMAGTTGLNQRRITAPSWNNTQAGVITSVASDTGAQTVGVSVAGRTANGTGTTGSGGTAATNSGGDLPPYLNLNFIIKV
jgi:microcystin-dependent protein